jgi:hypothetical protein
MGTSAPTNAKPLAQFAEESGEVVGQGLRQVALPYRVGGQEIQDVRVLDDVPDRFLLRFGDRAVEVCERGSRSFVQSAGDHRLQDWPRPALGNGALGVEVCDLWLWAAVEQGCHQAPGQSGNGALPDSGGPSGGQRCHVAQVAR